MSTIYLLTYLLPRRNGSNSSGEYLASKINRKYNLIRTHEDITLLTLKAKKYRRIILKDEKTKILENHKISDKDR